MSLNNICDEPCDVPVVDVSHQMHIEYASDTLVPARISLIVVVRTSHGLVRQQPCLAPQPGGFMGHTQHHRHLHRQGVDSSTSLLHTGPGHQARWCALGTIKEVHDVQGRAAVKRCVHVPSTRHGALSPPGVKVRGTPHRCTCAMACGQQDCARMGISAGCQAQLALQCWCKGAARPCVLARNGTSCRAACHVVHDKVSLPIPTRRYYIMPCFSM